MFKELLVIPNYQLSHNCMSHNIFLPHEGLQGFVANMGCNYPVQQQRGSGGNTRTRLGGVSVTSQSSLDFRLSSFPCPQVSMLIKRDWGEKFCQASASQREKGRGFTKPSQLFPGKGDRSGFPFVCWETGSKHFLFSNAFLIKSFLGASPSSSQRIQTRKGNSWDPNCFLWILPWC